MNRKRKSHRGLPRRVYVNHGAYFFVTTEPVIDPRDKKATPKKWIKLCGVDEGEPAMLAALAIILGHRVFADGSMPWCCAEFGARMLDRYTPATHAGYRQFLDVIADVFADFHATQVTTKDWADFLRARYASKANTARKITALGSRLFRFIIGDLGLRQDNPLDQLDMSRYRSQPRTVLARHDHVAAIRAAGLKSLTGRPTRSGPMFACIIDMAYLCWQRALDIRTLMESQIRPGPQGLVGGSLTFVPSKTSRTSRIAIEITITPAIANVIERARTDKQKHMVVSSYLFAVTSGPNIGQPFTKAKLFKMWDLARNRASEEAKQEGRDFDASIQFRDLRALGATDAAAKGEDWGEIQKRLAHTSERNTGIYIKKVIPKVSALDTALPWEDPPAKS